MALRSQTTSDHAGTRDLARRVRLHVLAMTYRARSSHVGTSFSMADILASLYDGVLRVRPSDPDWPDRDRLILSKGHGAAGLYAVLAERGFFSVELLAHFYLNGSKLSGHVTHHGVPGVEVSTGSLGHGLSMAAGMALVGKRDSRPYRVVTVLSDGECDEGSTWEAVLFAGHHQLDNLIAIVDYNKIQSLGTIEEVLDLHPFAEKWRAFRWTVLEIDGHDFDQIDHAFRELPHESGRPTCVIAHTVKGKGVSFMEHKLLWHYRSPDAGELARAIAELESGG